MPVGKPPIRVAIVAAGKIARDQHMPSIARNPGFDLVAVVDRKLGVPGLPNFPTIEALLASGPQIDAIAICTPPQVRVPIALAAIRAGKHVLLEKPPAATLSEAEQLLDAARQAGVTLFAAWHSRFAPMVETAQQWLATRTIRRGEIVWREDVRVWHPGQSWLWQPGGMGVFDPGINALSILTAICNASIHIVSAAFETPSNMQAPIGAQLTLKCGDAPIQATLDFRQRGTERWDITLETDDGLLVLHDGGARLTRTGLTEQRAPVAEYQGVYVQFGDLIARQQSDMDVAPLRLTADAFLIAKNTQVEPFIP